MNPRVVIDYNILGWGEKHREDLLKTFREVILVGKHPDLSRRSFDREVAGYCKLHDCVLITADARAYTHFFDAGVESVVISKVERWDVSDADLFMIKVGQEESKVTFDPQSKPPLK
jgi:hypothetical protein